MSTPLPRPFSPPAGTLVRVDFGCFAQEALDSNRFGLGLTQSLLADLFRDSSRQVGVDTFLRWTPRRERRIKLDSGRVLVIEFEVLREGTGEDHVCILYYRPEDEAL